MKTKTLFHVLISLATLASLSGCATHAKVKQADTIAKNGDWEHALIGYREAAKDHPNEKGLQDRIRHAEKEVAQLYFQRATAANAAGRLGEAGDLWKKAFDLDADEAFQKDIKDSIAQNESALDYYGDISMDYYSYDDAIGAYGALLIVHPESVDLIERYRAAKREYAGDLTLTAEDLTKRNLRGAALVASLRALQSDPMTPGAFDRAISLRKDLVGKTKVALPEVKVEDKGYRALGLALVPKLSPKLAEFPPYGPTHDSNAVQGSFTVTIEEFSKDEKSVKGVDEMPNSLPQPTAPVPNPAVKEQEKKIAGLEKELKTLQENVKKTLPGRTPKDRANSSVTRKKALTQADEQKRGAGLEAARKVDAKRKEIASAKLALAALPGTVPPPPIAKTWNLAWTETTRTVTARVRFDLHEKDMDQPVTMTLTRKITRTDRTHEGNGAQGVMPDPLELPSFDAMCAEMAGQFVEGADVIAQARSRRVEKLLAAGRAKHAMGNDDEALEAYVESMFILGPNSLPADAAELVGKASEEDNLSRIVAGPRNAPQASR